MVWIPAARSGCARTSTIRKRRPPRPSRSSPRGGLDGATYVWGEDFTPGGRWMANTWQGEFPVQNTRDDGYDDTSPVGRFPPNGYVLVDMIRNVWEWTADWYQAP